MKTQPASRELPDPRGDYAGSLVFEKTGKLEYVQHFLGHADLKRRWNGTIICSEKRLVLDIADFALPVKVAVAA